jgi:hypothetical protein
VFHNSGDPTPGLLVHDPLGLVAQLVLTGEYPAVVYIAYLCAGLAIGRLDLHCRDIAWVLLLAGLEMAVGARMASMFLLDQLGGLTHLAAKTGDNPAELAQLMWEPELNSSWWYLALPTPHSHTPIDLIHTLGSAMAVLGAALLLCRISAVARLLRPVAAAGSMALTLYSAHLLFLATGVLRGHPLELFLLMGVVALIFAPLWRRRFGQGPLERIVTTAAGSARRGAATLLASRQYPTCESKQHTHRLSQLLWPLVCAALLVVVFMAGARSVPTQERPALEVGQSESAEPAPEAPPSSPAAIEPPVEATPPVAAGAPATAPPGSDTPSEPGEEDDPTEIEPPAAGDR